MKGGKDWTTHAHIALPGTTTSQGKATVLSPLAPNTAPRPGRVLSWFALAKLRARLSTIVAPQSMRVPWGMLWNHEGAEMELMLLCVRVYLRSPLSPR